MFIITSFEQRGIGYLTIPTGEVECGLSKVESTRFK